MYVEANNVDVNIIGGRSDLPRWPAATVFLKDIHVLAEGGGEEVVLRPRLLVMRQTCIEIRR
jgi:hypothetical protein